MRVIGGTYRSRVLKSLKGNALRPTSDRLRETLFNVLGDGVRDSRFLDLFAGTGAIGIEALSRGAADVFFVEHHAPAANLIRANLKSLGLPSANVIAADALRGLERILSPQANLPVSDLFNYVFLDPPYDEIEEYSRLLNFLGSPAALTPDAIVIAEHRRKVALQETFGTLAKVRLLEQGDAALSFYRLQ